MNNYIISKINGVWIVYQTSDDRFGMNVFIMVSGIKHLTRKSAANEIINLMKGSIK
jgi:hypothetical protein